MLSFRFFGVPVTVEPWFWLVALFVSDPQRRPLGHAAVAVVLVFAGVLLHEMGHAVVARAAGAAPQIVLHGFGGLTHWRGPEMSWGRRIATSAAGPGVGITLGLLAILALGTLAPPPGGLLQASLYFAVWVNLGWGLLNLLPMLPLDGGSILATAAERLWGEGGVRAVHVLSLVVAAALGAWALLSGWIWGVLLLGFLAASNVQALRRT